MGTAYEWVMFLVVLSVTTGCTSLALSSLPEALRRPLWWGYWLRVLGALARYEVLFQAYRGVGDAHMYYVTGLGVADGIWTGEDISGLLSSGTEGTQALCIISGAVLTVLGPSLRAEFLCFSMAGYAGSALLALAHAREAEAAGATRDELVGGVYGLMCLPSLWFWPSSVGKEAIVFMGAGLVLYGCAGIRKVRHLISTLAGLGTLYLIRPHFATAFAGALVASEAIRTDRTLRSRLPVLLSFALLGWGLFQGTASQFSIDPTDLGSVDDFVSVRTGQTLTGGSKIEATQGALSIPIGLLTVFLRPFPWEAGGALGLFASLEVLALWATALKGRRQLIRILGTARSNTLLSASLVAAFGLALAMGLTFFNLGLLARQRAVVLLLIVVPIASAAGSRSQQG